LGDKHVANHVPLDVDDVIEGVVDHLLHVSYDERTVLRLTSTGDGGESVTAVGKALFGVKPGESLRLRGSWAHHPCYGRQFRAERCERTVPADERAIRLYLASGMVRGIGPALAAAIVDSFREQTLKVIDGEPERLLSVHNGRPPPRPHSGSWCCAWPARIPGGDTEGSRANWPGWAIPSHHPRPGGS
jgi:exodeoxyribonuclease V alpha subunit